MCFWQKKLWCPLKIHRVDAIELREEIEEVIGGEEILEFQFRGEEADLRTHFSGSATTEHPLTKALPLSGSMRVANMRNSREEIEYLHGDYMIERDRLFKVSDSLIVDEINDDKVKDSLT